MCALILILTVLTFNCVFTYGGPVVQRNQLESYLGDSCQLKDGSEGICQKLDDCKGSVKQFVIQRKYSEISLCAFDKKEPVLCCENINEDPELTPPAELNTLFQKLLCNNDPKPARLIQNIVGGKDANPGEFKHQVALGYQSNPQSPIEFLCGGSIISDKLILTAAHCVNHRVPKTVRMGRVSLVTDEYDMAPVVNIRITKDMIKIHPKYSRDSRQNDIAIIQFNKPIKFSDYIQPICLSGPKDLTYKNMTVTGFGTVNVDTKKRSDWLKKAIIQGTPFDECRANIKEARTNIDISDTQFCAKGKNNEDACQGDSGGPVIYEENNEHRLYGIISFANGCGGIPAVYTKIDKFHEWIASQML